MNNNEMIKTRVWQAAAAVGAILFVFLVALTIKEFKSLPYVGRDVPIMNSITIAGKGETVSIPDVATFSFSVTETAKTVDVAQTQATTKINNVLKAIKEGGVEEKDIKTLSYSINPHYEYVEGVCQANLPCRPGKSTITGYDVSQTIEVKVRDLKKAGALFSTIGSQNVQNINGLNFSIDDIDTVKSKARDLAIQNAKEKAQKLASQLGVRIVRVISFYEQGDESYPYAREAMGGDMMSVKSAIAPAPQIPTGEQKITSNVSITYEIR